MSHPCDHLSCRSPAARRGGLRAPTRQSGGATVQPAAPVSGPRRTQHGSRACRWLINRLGKEAGRGHGPDAGRKHPSPGPAGPFGESGGGEEGWSPPRCLPLGTVSSHSGATSWAPGFILLARRSPWEGRQRRGAGRGVDRARSAPRCEEAAGPGAPGTGVGCRRPRRRRRDVSCCRRPRRRHRLHALCGQGHCRTRVTPGSRAPRGA